MADTGIFATTAEVQRKVGANASSTANVEAYINDFMTPPKGKLSYSYTVSMKLSRNINFSEFVAEKIG